MSRGGAAAARSPSRRWTPEAAVAALIAGTAAARVLIAWATGLCFGESYYFSCALHPSLSYFDHPPLSILIGSLSLALGGEPGRLLLRAPFIALFAGTTWLLFLLGRRLFGAWAGFWAALLLNLSPIFTLSVGVFFQPEGALMFFWVACAWGLAHVHALPLSRRAPEGPVSPTVRLSARNGPPPRADEPIDTSSCTETTNIASESREPASSS